MCWPRVVIRTAILVRAVLKLLQFTSLWRSRLFNTLADPIRTIRDYSLFAIRDYSLSLFGFSKHPAEYRYNIFRYKENKKNVVEPGALR